MIFHTVNISLSDSLFQTQSLTGRSEISSVDLNKFFCSEMSFKMYTSVFVVIVAVLIAMAHIFGWIEVLNYNQEDGTRKFWIFALGTPVRDLPQGRPLNIVLLGKTGHGKSATANSIFGEKRFESYMSSHSVTNKCKMETGVIGGREIRLVDTPGTMDTRYYMESLKEIGIAIALLPEGFDAFLIVLDIHDRITNEEKMAITLLRNLFGDDVLKKYGVIVFTHGDIFTENSKKSKQTLPEYLQLQTGYMQNLLDECDNRYALIDNWQKDPGILREQVIQIITLVDKVVATNNGTRYTNYMFKMARQKLQEEQERLEKAKAELERKRQEQIVAAMKKEFQEYYEDEIQKIKDEYSKKIEEIENEMKNKAEKVGTDIAHRAGDNGACFPPDALVKLDDGRTITIADLRVGHKVLSTAAFGILEYSEVYFFAHMNPHVINEYINLSSSGHNLKLTPEHHIYIIRNGHLKTIAAREVKIGDSIIVLDNNMTSLIHDPVREIFKSTEVGVYAPITMSGTIIVNNVLASCYVDIVPPIYSHPMLWPLRQLYQLSPSFTALINTEGKRGMPTWVQYIMDHLAY